MQSINPATGAVLHTWDELSDAALDAAVAGAVYAQAAWRALPPSVRAGPLRSAARLLRERADDLARRMAEEMGKPLPQGVMEAEKCAWVCEHVADHGAECLAEQPVDVGTGRCTVTFSPLGVVLAIMPWNFPFWQVFRFAASALLAGNGVLVKHAPRVQGCAHDLVELLRDAGLPDGLYANLVIDEARVAALVARPEIAAVTLTGSTRAGRAVASAAGAALKKTVLELGGSDPYLVLEDADLARAAATCVDSRLINSGQSCVAAKRFLVVESVCEAFTVRMVELMKSRRWGDPLGGEPVDLGPLARTDLRDALHAQVTASVEAGARCLLGGEVPDGPGAFYPPTVLADVRPGMPAFDEETFGPVAAVVPVQDAAEAVRLANASEYGLGAAVFTGDVARGEVLADALQAGCCSVNGLVVSDPRVPFGGVKSSGYGRELSAFGMHEFVNVKSTWVRDGT